MSPRAARAFWLEKEVASLRIILDHMVQGNPLRGSTYWNGRFGVDGIRFSTNLSELPDELGRPDPNEVEHIIRDNPGDQPHADQPQQGRACSSGSNDLGELVLQAQACAAVGACHSVCPGNSLGGGGVVSPRDRAAQLYIHTIGLCSMMGQFLVNTVIPVGKIGLCMGLHRIRLRKFLATLKPFLGMVWGRRSGLWSLDGIRREFHKHQNGTSRLACLGESLAVWRLAASVHALNEGHQWCGKMVVGIHFA